LKRVPHQIALPPEELDYMLAQNVLAFNIHDKMRSARPKNFLNYTFLSGSDSFDFFFHRVRCFYHFFHLQSALQVYFIKQGFRVQMNFCNPLSPFTKGEVNNNRYVLFTEKPEEP
jgi:hypothetical protein